MKDCEKCKGKGKITEVVRKTKYVGMGKHYEIVPDWCKSISQSIITYLQQPTEPTER